MGRFPWSHTHARQTSDKSDKSVGSPQDWFSPSTNEPSRQALNTLMKEHNHADAEITQGPKLRSRSNTISSRMSTHSRSFSSEPSDDTFQRPESRQSTFFEGLSFGSNGQESSRNFFSKGSRMIKRKTSKLALQPAAFDDALAFLGGQTTAIKETSPPGRVTQRGSLSPKANHIRANISGPFGFQHVGHTDQAQYRSLNRAFMMDVVPESPVQKDMPETALEPHTRYTEALLPAPVIESRHTSPPLSPSSSIMLELPDTPPKPQPPPKDDLTRCSLSEMRMSKSVENFSRPNRSPVASFQVISSASDTTQFLHNDGTISAQILNTAPVLHTRPPSSTFAEAVNESLSTLSSPGEPNGAETMLDKPLPQPPTVVHAVSTVDDSALMMRTAPLPQIPESCPTATVSAGPGIPAEASTRRSSTANRQSLRHMQTFPSSKSAKRRSQSSSEIPFAMTFSAVSMPTSPPAVSNPKRVSIGIKKIDIDDWEDAIDYSWDHPLDLEDDRLHEMPVRILEARFTPLPQQVFTPPPAAENCRLPPPPPPLKPLVFKPHVDRESHDEALQSPTIGHGLQQPLANEMSLQGLGIAARHTPGYRSDVDAFVKRHPNRESMIIPAIRRDPGSPISKSSSQESIILSIASSIMGTQRSSHSSTSLSDLSHLESIEDESTSKRSLESTGGNISDASQDTVTTPATEASSFEGKCGSSASKKHEKANSISRANVPNRTSSIAALPASTSRSRSNTVNGNRPRQNSRVSYSLFPIPKATTSSQTLV